MPIRKSMDFLVKSGVTAVAVNVQFFNAAWAVDNFVSRNTVSNCLLAISMSLFGIGFLPILLQSAFGNISDIRSVSSAYFHYMLLNYSALSDVLIGFALLMYVLTVQIRFTWIREIVLYPSILDKIGFMISIAMFVVFSIVLRMVLPVVNSDYQNYIRQYGLVWIFYVMMVENALGFIFSQQIIGNVEYLNISFGRKGQRLMSARLSIVVFTWLFLSSLTFHDSYSDSDFWLQLSCLFSALVFTFSLKYFDTLESSMIDVIQKASAESGPKGSDAAKLQQLHRLSCKFGHSKNFQFSSKA